MADNQTIVAAVSNSFEKGWGKVMNDNIKPLRKEIMHQLGLTSMLSFRNRKAGLVEHSPAERFAIESVFEKYGVTEIWND